MAISSIVNNIHAQSAAGNIRTSLDALKTNASQLSSGQRIIEAKDDAAGLAIGVGLDTDQRTLQAAYTTSGQASAILSIADGGLNNISSILSRLKSLAASANSGAMGSNELGYIKNEMDALILEVNSVVSNTKFNGTKLLDGNYTTKNFQVGLASTDVIAISIAQSDNTAAGLNIASVDVTSNVAAANTSIDGAINTLKGTRAQVGALQSRFNYASANLESGINNISAAKSLYLDADFATVSTTFAANQTKLQAGVATLAQLNQLPSYLLKLLS